MFEFIAENKKITWLIIVALFILLMLVITRFSIRALIEKAREKDSSHIATLQSIRRILNLFFMFLGIGLASYTFFDGEAYEIINKNIERIIWIAFIAVATRIGADLTHSYFRRRIELAYLDDEKDATTYKYLKSLSTFFIYLVGLSVAAYAIPSLRFVAQSALTGAGMIALIIGVASQEAISNLVSGAFIVAFKPFKVGQTVQIGTDIKGVVEDLTLRHTVIRDFQNRRIVIPNSVINKENITNFNMGDPKVVEWFEVGISYDSDVDLALAIIKETAENHPLIIDNRTPEDIEAGKPIVDVRVVAWADSSVNLRAWLWAAESGDGVLMRHELLKSVKAKFEANGIEIPFPHRVILFKEEKEQEKEPEKEM